MDVTRILEDKRKVKSIYIGTAGDNYSASDEIEIIPYGETGDGAYKPWFAIFQDGKLTTRVNGVFVSFLVYADEIGQPI